MKIVVSTFNNSKNNYGALFQSCGLSSFLTGLGHDAFYVTVQKRVQNKQSKVNRAKQLARKLLLLPHAQEMKRREHAFRRFAAKTQKQIVYASQEALFADPPSSEVYLSGSDQVWNPVSMHEDLFLAYAPQGSKKISYAASMGAEKIPEQNKKRFAERIAAYDTISVREDTVAEIVAPFTDKHIEQHIDPVFLKPRSAWECLESPYRNLKFDRYILTYVIEWNETFNRRLQELKQKTGLPVVSVNLGNIKKICADQVIYDASPEEFLSLLHGADYMVASSFHGIAMAIVYEKPFLPCIGKNMPSRIASLMRHFEIDVNKTLQYGEEDFSRIHTQILQDRANAEQYFLRVLRSTEI